MSRLAPPRTPPGTAPANKGRRYPAEVLTPDEVRALLRACNTRSSTGLRARALIALMYRAGLRLGEALDLYPGYVRRLLPRLGERAGIERRVHAHGLRHAHAAELAREGLPTNLIQAQLGHASLATTDRYLRHIAPAELIAAVQGRTWSL